MPVGLLTIPTSLDAEFDTIAGVHVNLDSEIDTANAALTTLATSLATTNTAIGAQLRVALANLNLGQAAGTYTALTATGDVYVEVAGAFMKTAAGGLTSALVETNHAGGAKSIVASALLAVLGADVQPAIVTTSFVLPTTKVIRYTIVGTGNAGVMVLVVKWAPVTAGATLA